MASQETKFHKNTFSSGISQDISDDLDKNDVYRDADNIDLVEHDEYFAPTNIKGTESVEQLVSGDYAGQVKFLKSENADITLETAGGSIPGVVSFFAHRNGASSNDELLVYFFAKYSGGTHLLELVYSETIAGIYDGHVDSVGFGEGGFDYVYFTVKDSFLGTIKCTIDEASPQLIEEKDIKLLKEEPKSIINSTTVLSETGASLFTGTYSFAVRLLDNTTNSFTKWSLITWPTQITPTLDAAGFSEGVIGVSTNKSIQLDIDIDSDAVAAGAYNYYQIAVIENIDGTTVPQSVAYVQDIVPLSIGVTNYQYDYTSNSTSNQVPIDSIVTDLAQIQSFGTINIKDNLLFGANVTYKNLEYDRGDPVVGSVDYILDNSGVISDSYRDDNFATTSRGYFRGEVYRFYITYYDEDYNFAFPKVLDFTGVTGAIVSSGYDLAMPDRYNTSYGHICGTGEETYALGLRFNDIVNHPTWAVGCVILRAKRNKNILGQAAVVPVMKVEPALQWQGFPEFPNEDYPSGTSDDTIEPADPLGTYVPKIFGGMITKDIRRGTRLGHATQAWPEYRSQSGNSTSYPDVSDSARQMLLYSPEFIYTSAGNPLGDFNQLTGANIEPVDACLLNGVYAEGEHMTVSKRGRLENYTATTFYAYNTSDYYNADSRVTNRNDLQNRGTQKLREVDLVAEGGSAVTAFGTFGDHESMKLSGYTDGYVPTTQKGLLVTVDDPRLDIAFESMDAAVSNTQWLGYNTYKYGPSATGDITSANVNFDTNQFNEEGAAVSAIEIVNITKGLGEDRYGNKSKQWEAISTGAETRLASVGDITAITTDVWGGDCFIGKFTFKISDRGYALVNPTADNDLENATEKDLAVDYWKTWFAVDDAAVGATYDINQPRPIGVSALAETISVYVESEINTSIDYKDAYRVASNVSVTDSTVTISTLQGQAGAGNFETWNTMQTAGMINFSNASDVSVPTSTYGQFSNGSIFNVFTATAPFTNAVINCSGTLNWSSTNIIETRLVIEKLDAANNKLATIISDINGGIGAATHAHTTTASGTFSLAIGEKLRIISGAYDSDQGTPTYPTVSSGSHSISIGNSSAVIGPDTDIEYLTPFTYRYHGGYSVENESKIFTPEPEGFVTVSDFRSRIMYSEQKVVNSDVSGFDTFPVLNFYDLEETYGKVTKLAKIRGELYSIQDTAVAALPINANVMQTADGTSLSIRSADVIGRPNWITSSKGSRNIQAVMNEDDKLYFVDGQDAGIYTPAKGDVENIAEGRLESFFHSNINDEDLTDIRLSYSKDHKELYVTKNTDFNYVFNTKFGFWKTNLGLRGDSTSYNLGGVFSIDSLTYFVGQNDNNTNRARIDYAYSDGDNRGMWFGDQSDSNLTFKMNGDVDFPKTMDALAIHADNDLDSMEMQATGILGDFDTGTITLLGTNIDGVHKVKKYRNILDIAGKTGQKIRGNTATVKINWDNPGGKSTLKSVITKYRLSKRVV
jgi:hypothetical protein